jgi:hypothetical protein
MRWDGRKRGNQKCLERELAKGGLHFAEAGAGRYCILRQLWAVGTPVRQTAAGSPAQVPEQAAHCLRR